MIRPLLRKLKQYLWRQAGITHLAHNEAHTHQALVRLQGMLDFQGQTLCRLSADLARVDDIARQQDTLRQEFIEVRRGLVQHEHRTSQAFASMLSTLTEHEAAIRQSVAELNQQMVHEQTLTRESQDRSLAIVTSELAGVAACVAAVRTEAAGWVAVVQDVKSAGDAACAETERLQATLAERLQATLAERCDALHTHLEAKADALYAQGDRIASSLPEIGELRANHERLAGVLGQIDSWGLDKWRIQEYMGLIRYFRRKQYQLEISTGRLPVPILETAHPVAALSNDTLFPRGAKNDNSICPRFNRKLTALLAHKPRLRVLDLGCAGGGLVRSLLDEGHFAVGLEGSPHPQENQLGEWATIPHHLHTCDITQPFTLRDPETNAPIQFDAITAWEVMEHIPEAALPGLFANLHRHLAPGGMFLCSIATFLDHDAAAGVIWHVTVKSMEWWVARFREGGFDVYEQTLLGKEDWLRGSGHCRGDWHEDEDLGFHLVLRRRAVARAAA